VKAATLAVVDAALAHTRELTMRRLAQQAKQKPRRPWMPKWQRRDLAELRRAEILDRRQRMAEKPMPVAWSPETQPLFDAHYCEVETRLERERRHAAVREIMAAKCTAAAHHLWDCPTPPRAESEQGGRKRKRLEPLRSSDMRLKAEKLTRARRSGHWGTHVQTGKLYIRYWDRSGLPLLDPSESQRNGARFGRRLVPELERWQKVGYHLYYAVASEPNVPADRLAWGKRNIFRRVRRDIYDRFPEIVGLVAAQEDPLSADGRTWNVHVNLLLIVDPRQCTPLTEEVARQLDLGLRGNSILLFTPRPVPPDPTPPGLLSFAKLHRAWGPHQFHLEKLKSSESIGRSLREILKYSAKMVPAARLARQTGEADDLEDSARAGESAHRSDADQLAGMVGADRAARDPDGETFVLGGGDQKHAARHAANCSPPGLSEYPIARFVEFLESNRRFRRVRTWGCLYELPPEELPEDPDKLGLIRWHGRVRVSSRHIFVEAARLSFVSSIHGFISGADFPDSTGQSPANQIRAGPASAQRPT